MARLSAWCTVLLAVCALGSTAAAQVINKRDPGGPNPRPPAAATRLTLLAALPHGWTDHAYAGRLQAVGGTTPYMFDIVGGSLPPGLALDASSGEITGTPTAAGLFQFYARVSGARMDSDTRLLRITIGERIGLPLPPVPSKIIEVAAGWYHNCAIRDDGALKCWGQNLWGKLGLGDTDSRGDTPSDMGDALPALDLGTNRRVLQIALGGHHSCAVLDGGQVKCWGSNLVGELGLGDTSNRGDDPGEMGNLLPSVDLGLAVISTTPIPYTARQVAAGGFHTCALLDDGKIKCWGWNSLGQLGQGDTVNRGDGPGEMGGSLPAVDLGGQTALQIAAGHNFNCALLQDGQVKCWGDNTYGQLGLGDTLPRGDGPGEMGTALPSVNLGTGRRAVQVVAHGWYACALLDNGQVKCWGNNFSGTLGLGDTAHRGDNPGEMGDSLPAVDLGTGRSATRLAAGQQHTCALLDNAALKCWGAGWHGALGLGDVANRGDDAGEMGDSLLAVGLGTHQRALHVTAGVAHTCAWLDDGQVKCWGLNTGGILGLGTTLDQGDEAGEMGNSLAAVDLGTRFQGSRARSLAAGYEHSCAIVSTGLTKCWGRNQLGQLGLGDTSNRGDAPAEMGESLPAIDLGTFGTVAINGAAISAGGYHTCAWLDTAQTKCWGYNVVGQLGLEDVAARGDGSGEMGNSLPTVNMSLSLSGVHLTTGFHHTCARLENGQVKCWGYNISGQLGLGDTSARGDAAGEMGDSLPLVMLGTGRSAVQLTAGFYHTCALLDDRSVKCWGLNAYGQLGLGDTANRGDDPGEMGDSLPAVDLGTGRTAFQIAAGGYFTCALLDNGMVKCWGYNGEGQLGLGDTAARGDSPSEMGDSLPAVPLGAFGRAVQLTASSGHVCARTTTGHVKCWGNNSFGQLGLGDTSHRGDSVGEIGDSLAVDLGTGRSARWVSTGGFHTCAWLDTGHVRCWGYSPYGQLGLGDTVSRGDGPGEMGDSLPVVDLGVF